MSGGGGSQTVAGSPWGPATPYLTSIMQQAQELYGRQAPQYSNPAGNFNYGNTTAALGNVISGQPDYSAVSQAIGAANTQQWDQFNNQVIPQLNQNASFLGNPTGSIKDLNSAVTNLTRNQSLNAQQAYLGEYDLAKQRQMQGLGMYPTIAGMPNQALSDYANLIANTGGRYSTETSALQPGSGQTASNIIGGLTSGVGLYNQLFGGSGSTPLGTQAVNYAKGIFAPSTAATANQGVLNAAANPSVYDMSGITSTGSGLGTGGASLGAGAGLGSAAPAFAAGGVADVAGTAAASDLAGASLLPSTEAYFAGSGAAGGSASGAGLGASSGVAPVLGTVAPLAIAAYGLTRTPAPTGILRVGAGQSQVGVSAQGKGVTTPGLQQGNMVLGAGGAGSTGANNFFTVNPSTGKQTWVGKDMNNTLRNIGSVVNPTNLAQITYNPKATYSAGGGMSLSKPTRGTAALPYDAGGWNGSTMTASQASDFMSGAYNKLGGPQVLGDFKTWLSQLSGLMANIGR